ncbi:MAG: DUF2851 family protein [Chitinophagaceae bacterium]|nr:DUF2851 family protein [Chitinophagaceae bacterium]
MNERLLQFIWQHQYFNREALQTCAGQTVQIIFQGSANTNQGPDFFNARIIIDDIQLAGTVELHLKTSNWNDHGHGADKHYNNVILHVVWEHDGENDEGILELKDRVASSLLNRYAELMQQPDQIPCHHFLSNVHVLVWSSWKERLVAERMMQKMIKVQLILQQTNRHWEEVFWQLLCHNFGVPLNGDVFEAIARSIPVSLLAKHKNQIHQLEAMLLGQAGLLEGDFTDAYAVLLQKEYHYLKKKYQLQPVHQLLNFLRMRPSNFPTIRLAQVARLVHQSSHLFSKIVEAKELNDIKQLFAVTANDFWHTHYTLTESSAFKKKTTGAVMIDSLLINTIIPLLFVYAAEHDQPQVQQKAIQWLQQLPKEKNRITLLWEAAGAPHSNAFDSQALLQLKKFYCNERKCLNCSVGNSILKKS